MRPLVIVYVFGRMRYAPTVDCCNSVPTPWGSFRSLRFRAHAVGKLSQLAIPCPRRGEAFAACNSVPTPWGSFRSLRFRAHTVGKLSQPAIPCPRRGEAFAACDSVPTVWGGFRILRFRAHGVGRFSQALGRLALSYGQVSTGGFLCPLRCSRPIDSCYIRSRQGLCSSPPLPFAK